LIVTLYKGGRIRAVKIRELNVPEYRLLKSANNEDNINEDIVLDCDYEYKPSEAEQLAIYWYFNGDNTFFYQWIPSKNKPQLNVNNELESLFRNHVDLEYIATGSKDDPFKKHRALVLRNPTVALSGSYECKVATLESEDRQRKEMKLITPAKEVIFRQDPLPNGDQVNVSCAATGIFPQPQIKLLRGSYQLDDSEASVTTSRSGEVEENDTNTIDTFDIVVHRVVDHSEIPQQTKFGCELTIPGTEYKEIEVSAYKHRGGRYHAAYESSSTTSYRLSSGFINIIITFLLLSNVQPNNL